MALLIGVALGAYLVTWLLPGNPLTFVVGLPVALVVPGYTTNLLLFPRRSDLDTISRAILVLATTVVLLISFGLPFVLLTLPFEAPWLAGGLLLLTGATALGVEYRRGRIQPEERFMPRLPRLAMSAPTVPEAVVAIGVAATLVAAGAILYEVAIRPPGGAFTALYLLDAQGKAIDYPNNVTVGSTNRVLIRVVSRENSTLTFRLLVGLVNASTEGITNETSLSSLSDRVHNFTLGQGVSIGFALARGATWEDSLDFAIGSPGTYRLRFYLLRDGTTIYREAFMWVNATAP